MGSGPESKNPDADLVRRIAAGDADALAEAFELYAARLNRIAYGITGSISDAEDVVQDVFVGLPEGLSGFEGRSSLATWLHRVTVRAALLRVKTDRRRRELLRDLWERAATTRFERTLSRIDIERALNRLPAMYRTVLWLKDVEGWTHEQIAHVLGIETNTSYQRLHRARKLLRTRLDGGR
ncbi:MAG: sigma-70 family RNA polymerase sigma factor [Gemmatimonadetes bacterium]|nr:sigma-70 family RNA polymerase sigma factor [Gemmatimonadota bacterium]